MLGIICFWDRLATPYLAKYERVLNENDIHYETVFWNRTPEEGCKRIVQNRSDIYINLKCNSHRIAKIRSFLRWAKYTKSIISTHNYSHLIVLSTMPAVLLFLLLQRKYKEKYIFDIRDYTFESNKLFKRVVMKLINGSCFSTISSKGYYRWLDNTPKLIVNHNITVENSGETWSPPTFKDKDRLNLAFVGNVRLDMQTEALLRALKNDPKIDQFFYGRIIPSCCIQKIKDSENIKNIYLMGPFTVSDKKKIFQQVDLINCVYANSKDDDNIPLGDSTPLPNRLYDALEFMRPIVVSKGTYLAELVKEFHLGVCVNGFSPAARDEIMEYVNSFNSGLFIDGCKRLQQIVVSEELVFLQKLKATLHNWENE